jgi:hypothetical protein
MIYHVLNRGNGRMRIFRKARDFEAFERVLAEGLQRYEVDLLSAWPLERSRNWIAWVNRGLNDEQLEGIRSSVNRGRPLGPESWVQRTAERLGLEFTLRGPGRPRTKSSNQ